MASEKTVFPYFCSTCVRLSYPEYSKPSILDTSTPVLSLKTPSPLHLPCIYAAFRVKDTLHKAQSGSRPLHLLLHRPFRQDWKLRTGQIPVIWNPDIFKKVKLTF